MWEDALQEEEIIAILMPTEMWNLVFLSTILLQISGK